MRPKAAFAVLALVVALGCGKSETYPPPAPTPVPTVSGVCDPCVSQCPDWKSIGPVSGGVAYQNVKTGEQKICK